MARLTALVKTKNFEQALDLIKGKEKKFSFEHAYLLHRQGKNREALAVLASNQEKEHPKVKHLLA